MQKNAEAPSSPLNWNMPFFGQALGDTLRSLSSLQLPPDALARLQTEYVSQATAMWNDALATLGQAGRASAPPADRRFAHNAWNENPVAAMAAQTYLLNARTMLQMVEEIQGDEKTKGRIRFAVQQWVDAASPANFLALNPEALAKAMQTKGESVLTGVRQMMGDIAKGNISQSDDSAFEVGRNVACTPGSVVFENRVFQLIEYRPTTEQVYERPMLMVPPCINKFYLLDLQPENSVIRYTVEQGHRTFVMSWRNPDQSLAGLTWDEYIAEGPLKAIEVVREITGVQTFNMLGFCVGGTILTTALAVAAERGEQPANSLTLLTTLLDFSDAGVLELFIDEAGVQLREMTIGADAPTGPGLLRGSELATTFSFLRPNDLVWNYVVGNYLKGEAPPPFDLLYWNADSTNLPGAMFCWYLRHTYLQNDLKQPRKVTTCGVPVDFSSIQAPVFIYASREDHIVPWQGAYLSTRLFKGPARFVLGASGHIAGVINPASKNKRNYWTNETLPVDAADWFATATEAPGSWWPNWAAWLGGHGGGRIAAPQAQGSASHPPIEPAPGRYVKQKA